MDDKLISEYLALIKEDKNQDELYKWEAITHFQENWDENVDDFYEMFKQALKKRKNLIFQNSFGFLNKLGQNFPDDLKQLFEILYDENVPVDIRYKNYKEQAELLLEKLKEKLERTNLNHQQDERTISFLLTLKNPDKYYLYKENVYIAYCEYLGIDKNPTVGEKYKHFSELGDLALPIIRSHKELYTESDVFIPKDFSFNSDKLLFQDIIYRILIQQSKKEKRAEFLSQLMDYVQNKFEEQNHSLKDHLWQEATNDSYRQISIFPFEEITPIWQLHYELMFGAKSLRIEIHPEGSREFKDDFKEFISSNSNSKYDVSNWKTPIRAKVVNNEYQKIVSKQKIEIKDFYKNFSKISDEVFEEISLIYDTYNKHLLEFFNNSNMKTQVYIDLLELNKNLILTGAPGTGKTYLAKKIAQELISIDQQSNVTINDNDIEKHIKIGQNIKTKDNYTFRIESIDTKKVKLQPLEAKNTYNVSFQEIKDCIKNRCYTKKISESNNSGNGSYIIGISKFLVEQLTNLQIEFVQFHPSYDYTDFVEGLRPKKNKDDKELGFELKNGIFKAFCKRAKDDPNNTYVFIIDEINRAEISKVFGELFFSIDPGYRGEEGKVKTQYANIQTTDTYFTNLENDFFYVPKNVYIIGTMNDIDRSVESFDFAMRRRFAWKEITADSRIEMLEEELKEHKDWIDTAKNKLQSLNNSIYNTADRTGIEGLNSSYHIGPAYFLKIEKYKGDFTQLWDNHLKVLLHEYLRGMRDAEAHLSALEEAYNSAN
jgi:5-methylcytosine-specific restriction endonuclease McrBC GTP-binding regulatory subunit McrB